MSRIGVRANRMYWAVAEAMRDDLIIATVQIVAGHLNISDSTARKYLKVLERDGIVRSRSATGYNSNTGRMTNVIEFAAVEENRVPAGGRTDPCEEV